MASRKRGFVRDVDEAEVVVVVFDPDEEAVGALDAVVVLDPDKEVVGALDAGTISSWIRAIRSAFVPVARRPRRE